MILQLLFFCVLPFFSFFFLFSQCLPGRWHTGEAAVRPDNQAMRIALCHLARLRNNNSVSDGLNAARLSLCLRVPVNRVQSGPPKISQNEKSIVTKKRCKYGGVCESPFGCGWIATVLWTNKKQWSGIEIWCNSRWSDCVSRVPPWWLDRRAPSPLWWSRYQGAQAGPRCSIPAEECLFVVYKTHIREKKEQKPQVNIIQIFKCLHKHQNSLFWRPNDMFAVPCIVMLRCLTVVVELPSHTLGGFLCVCVLPPHWVTPLLPH